MCWNFNAQRRKLIKSSVRSSAHQLTERASASSIAGHCAFLFRGRCRGPTCPKFGTGNPHFRPPEDLHCEAACRVKFFLCMYQFVGLYISIGIINLGLRWSLVWILHLRTVDLGSSKEFWRSSDRLLKKEGLKIFFEIMTMSLISFELWLTV